ncbi:hypothetical protein [Chryseolinea soli]|uniref:Uncharacterized protein n=1 Tax=Chryseolinea soli TaxID=2321403 RepID=A0A385SKR9_9BACT|nr:hypothetical protein [Chryseolinea soli]AYB31482.1 hypothetical protein D4L85_13240 [Chryseolinea soli]
MTITDEIRTRKINFVDAVTTPSSGHKLIRAAKELREIYASLPEDDQGILLEWVTLTSDLDKFVSGEDRSYYTPVAVLKKGLRRANLEHLQRYTSEETGDIEGMDSVDDEYTFNIWKSEWIYVETFLKQFEIRYRVLS